MAKTLREMMDLVEAAQTEQLDEGWKSALAGAAAASALAFGAAPSGTFTPQNVPGITAPIQVKGELPTSPMVSYLITYNYELAQYIRYTDPSADPYFAKLEKQLKPIAIEADTMRNLLKTDSNPKSQATYETLLNAAVKGHEDAFATIERIKPADSLRNSNTYSPEQIKLLKADLEAHQERLKSLLK